MAKETNEKKAKIPTKSIIILVALLIIFITLIGIGFALFSDKDNASLNIAVGKVEVTLTEDTEWQNNQDEYGIEKYVKNVKGVAAQDSKPAYVRIKTIPVVQYYEETPPAEPGGTATGEWLTAPVPQNDILVLFEGTDWVQSGDYWYYNKAIKAGEQTTNLNIRWQVLQLATELATKEHLRTDVRVVLEYAQAENDVWKSVFNIQELPFE